MSKHWTKAPHFLTLSWATWAPVILSDILEMPQGWLQSDNSSLAVLVWMRKLTRSRFHCSCQCGKPITLGWWETQLPALAVWVTSRYPPDLRQSDCIISLLEVPSYKKKRKRKRNDALLKSQVSKVGFYCCFLKKHQIFGCKISVGASENWIQLQDSYKNNNNN